MPRWGARGRPQATSCSMPAGVLSKRFWTPVGRAWASRKSLQTSTPTRIRLMKATSLNHEERATRTDGVPVHAGEYGVLSPVTIRTAERRFRSGPNLLSDLEVLADDGLAPKWFSSSTTQDSMGNEWMTVIYQRFGRNTPAYFVRRLTPCAAHSAN